MFWTRKDPAPGREAGSAVLAVLALDSLRQPLPERLEAEAQHWANGMTNEPNMLVGYLEASIIAAINTPPERWEARRESLLVDLRIVEIARSRR